MTKSKYIHKVCFVIPVLVVGGAERVMSEIINYFSTKSNIECHLILYGKDADIFYDMPKTLTVHRPKRKFEGRYRLISAINRFFFLRKTVTAIDPHVVLSFGEIWNSFVLLALKGLPYRVYISDRCQPDKTLPYLHDNLRKWLYPKAAGIISQTALAKDIYSKRYKHSNIRVIGNPIREIPAAQENMQENIILSVGRLIKSKNHEELIKLFASLEKTDWKLVIVGEDALKQQNKAHLQSLIDRLNATENITLAGKRTDVDNFYRKSKIFAFTSSSEGFPNVIGEAMSAGLPVIAFDCVAGPAEMIQDGENGYLVPLFDYDTFKERLLTLMNNSELRNRLGRNAQVSIKRFSTDIIGQRVYQFLIQR